MTTNQMQILQVLIEANEPEAIPLLMDCLASDDQDIVLFAASAIGDTATKMKDICNIAVAELVEALSSDNPQVRKCILTTLMLLDVPFCYSDAITNVMMVDNQPYNQALAKKIIQNIINNDFSEFDYGSCSSSTFKEGTLIQNKDYNTSSESAEHQKQINKDMIENMQAKQNINLVSEKNIIDESIEQDVEILPILCNTDASYTSVPDENNESLLLALEVAMNPENLISDDLWFDWSLQLESHPIASQLIFDVANEIGLPWASTRKYESFDQYLGLPLQKIFKKLGWKNNRTFLICVANAVLSKWPKSEPVNVINDNKPKSIEQIKKVGKITFDELYSTDNPINLISNEMWDEWTNLIIDLAARKLYISDIVDELGSLFWQARWKSEKIFDYCLYSLDDIKNISNVGKSKTIIICMAKVAIDALSKLELSANDDNELIQEYSLNQPVRLIADSVLIANEQPESNVDDVNTIFDKIGIPAEPIKAICKPSFAELYSSDNPITLISNEIWEDWTSFVINYAPINKYISDMVDELGLLFWQSRWNNEKIFDYCLYSLDDIKNISNFGKSKTIIICMAKVAIDALSKLELSANDDNELIQEYSLNQPIRLITDSVLIANEKPESNADILLATSVAGYSQKEILHSETMDLKTFSEPELIYKNSNSENYDELIILMDDDDTITLS